MLSPTVAGMRTSVLIQEEGQSRVKKFFVLELQHSGASLYFTDDYGGFGLTPDLDSAVQWDQGNDALAYLEELRRLAPDQKHKDLVAKMKVEPHGFN